MNGKVWYKILSVVASVSLLLNSLWGIFLFPQTVFAEEATESAELELIEEVVPTPEPSPTPLPTPDSDESEPIELSETLVEELEESPVVEESASLVVSLWTENEDGSVITNSTVGEGVEYRYKDTQTKVLFTKLTEPGYLTIREFEPENAEELGILGKAYEITSDMQDETFEYDLTLPLSEEVGDDFEIKYAEDGDSLNNAQIVEELKEESENTVTIRGLDHFTVFIITDDEAVYSGGLWIDYSTQGYYDDGVHYPATVPAGQTATWTFSSITPGEYRVYVSWSTHENRTTSAPYVLNYNSGSINPIVDQERLADQVTIGGSGEWSGWYGLGTYSLNTSSTIVLNSVNNTSGTDYVIADEILLVQNVAPDQVWVNDNYNINSKNDGHVWNYDAFATIQDGIDAVNSGGTVSVAAGIYTDDIWDGFSYRIEKSVTLLGAQAGNDPAGSLSRGEETILVRTNGLPYSLYASDITIDGFMFGSSDSNTGGRLIVSDVADGAIIQNNIIQNTPSGSSGHGVYIYPGATSALVEYNTFSNTAWEAIRSDGNVMISNNTIKDIPTNKGIYLGASSNTQIINNIISNTYYEGIQAAAPTVIQGNDISGCYKGIQVRDSAIGTIIEGNNIYDNTWEGIQAFVPVTIQDNEISGGYHGIQIRNHTAGSIIDGNNIHNNAIHGIEIPNYGGADPDVAEINIINNILTSNGYVGIEVGGGAEGLGIHINHNSIYGNGIHGVESFITTSNIDAIDNWWGHVSGPFDGNDSDGSVPLANFGGLGNTVVGAVNYGEWAVNPEFTFYAPVNLGWNIRSESSLPGERPVDLTCGGFTNADFDLYGDGKISQNWELIGAPVGVKYQRQWMWPGSGSWSTDGTAYTNNYIPFSTFGSLIGTEGEWNTRVRSWMDMNGNGSLDMGIDLTSNWSNECAITYDRTTPVTTEPLDSPEDGSFWNSPIQIQGVSTDNFITNLLNLFYKPADTSDPWTPIASLSNPEGDAVFDWSYLWTPIEGIYDIMAAAVDVAGNEEESAYANNITYDVTAPDVEITSPTSTLLSGIVPIRGTVTDENPHHYWLVIQNSNGATVAGPGVVNDTSSFVDKHFFDWDTTAVTDGTYIIKLEARDAADNKDAGSVQWMEVVVDNTAPEIIFEDPTNGSVHAGAIHLRATCNEECDYINFWWRAESEPYSSSSKRYHYVHDNGTVFEWGLNSLNAEKWGGDTYLMEDGTYYLYAAGKDLAGNWARTPNVQIVIDNTKPNSVINSPSSPSYFNEPIIISGQTIDSTGVDEVTLSYSAYDSFADTCGAIYTSIETINNTSDDSPFNWFSTPWTPLVEGNYCIKASGKDIVGNIEDSAIVRGIIYDITNPTLDWTSPVEDTIISGTTVILSVATDNLSGVESVVYSYQRDDGVDSWHEIAILTSSPYEVSWDTTGLALDDYNLKVVVTDRAGNIFEDTRRVGVAAVISSESWSRPGWGEITISWTTDRPTNGRVVYDTVSHSIDLSHPNYGYANTSGTVDTSPKTLSHTITLSGLTNSETYYWRTVSGGSPKVISSESRGDTFSIPGGVTGGGGVVAGVTTSAITTPFPYAELEDTSTPEEDSEEVLGEETEIDTEELETPLDEAVGILSRTAKGRILAISAFLLGLILYFISRRRRE